MSKKFIRISVLLILLPFLFAGCTDDQEVSRRDQLLIVTSFYPIYISAVNITYGMDDVEVINLTSPDTGCLHDYQLTPDDLKHIEEADVFIMNGAGMEGFIDKLILQNEDIYLIDASEGIELIYDENGDENPHVWVSISNSIIQVKNIAGMLASFDPDNSSVYSENAGIYTSKLYALETDFHEILDQYENKKIVTFHDAFDYFARDLGIEVAAIIENDPGVSPSPKEIEDIISILKDNGIGVVFTEPQYSDKIAETISRETGAVLYVLDPVVTGSPDVDAKDTYIQTMNENLKVLKEAFEKNYE